MLSFPFTATGIHLLQQLQNPIDFQAQKIMVHFKCKKPPNGGFLTYKWKWVMLLRPTARLKTTSKDPGRPPPFEMSRTQRALQCSCLLPARNPCLCLYPAAMSLKLPPV